MRYAKGDKVIIKSREWYDKNKDESGIITFNADRGGGCNFTKQDACFCGRVVTIKYAGYGYYLIAEDDRGYAWVDEMIEAPSTSIYNEGDIVGVYTYEPDIRAVRIEEVRLEGLRLKKQTQPPPPMTAAKENGALQYAPPRSNRLQQLRRAELNT